MGARKNINRYKEDPCGTDFATVLKKGKRHFCGEPFMVWGGRDYGKAGVWMASRLPDSSFKLPSDARVFEKRGRYWWEVLV